MREVLNLLCVTYLNEERQSLLSVLIKSRRLVSAVLTCNMQFTNRLTELCCLAGFMFYLSPGTSCLRICSSETGCAMLLANLVVMHDLETKEKKGEDTEDCGARKGTPPSECLDSFC